MKRFFSLLLIFAMLCSLLAGCTKPNTETEPPTQAPTEAPTQEPTEEPTEPPTEEPTEEPTEAPTEAPTQAPTQPPANNPGTNASREPALTAGPAKVDPSFFDDAVFIGDSVSLKLSYYAAKTGALGATQFLVAGSLGMRHLKDNDARVPIKYQGQTMIIEDAVAATGAKKVFIMLGMNDLAITKIDGTIACWQAVTNRILAKCPDVEIFVQSMTPVIHEGQKGSLKNPNINDFNAHLKAFADGAGFTFIDIAPYMKDGTGGLVPRFCSDNFVHLTDAGAAAWVKALLAFDYPEKEVIQEETTPEDTQGETTE